MDYSWFIVGILGCIVGVALYPIMKREAQKDGMDNITVKGFISSLLLVILGLVLIVRELSKTV
jgi:hypothetical protein